MRSRTRLTELQRWVYENFCAGRMMKAPGEEMDIADIRYKEPDCYIAWMPQRKNEQTCQFEEGYLSTTPSITIMPNASRAKAPEEKRFDRYGGVHRPKDMGQTLSVSMLFSVYEPGIRLPGFAESGDVQDRMEVKPEQLDKLSYRRGIDMGKILEGTQEGLFTLTDWMDECMEKLLGTASIPGTDMFINEESIMYSLYTDQNYVVDKRPIYYGFINLEFICYAERSINPEVENLL